jgi:hypothetical protein
MKTTPQCQSPRTRSTMAVLLCPLVLAGGMLCFCVGVGLQLPPARSDAGKNFRMPPGQLQADVRTVGAALRYLLEPETDNQLNPAVFSGNAFAIQVTGRPYETFAYASNLTDITCAPSTNRPDRI